MGETELMALIASLLGGGGVFGSIVGWAIKKAFNTYTGKIDALGTMLTDVNQKIAVYDERDKRVNEIIEDFRQASNAINSHITKLSETHSEFREEQILLKSKMQAAFKLIDDHTKKLEKLDDRLDNIGAGK